jgi:hypothetical protein
MGTKNHQVKMWVFRRSGPGRRRARVRARNPSLLNLLTAPMTLDRRQVRDKRGDEGEGETYLWVCQT